MSDLDFIADVIYDLKHEYGETIIVGSKTTNFDAKTGNQNATITEFTIKRAIPLPWNVRQFFARFREGRKEGFLNVGERQILIDIADIPKGATVPTINGYIKYNGTYSDIVSVESYEYAIILAVKSVAGMPIPS